MTVRGIDQSARLRVLLQVLVLTKLPFVLYRLPHEQPRLLLMPQGQPSSYQSLSELDAASGFVMAPFTLEGKDPIVLWPQAQCVAASGWDEIDALLSEIEQPVYRCKVRAADEVPCPLPQAEIVTLAQGQYQQDFAGFSAALRQGSYQKLVLSSYFEQEIARCFIWDNFMRACAVKPELMVALVQAPQVGTWFVATPEVLLRTVPGTSARLHTMALAGTMPYSADNMELAAWSTKDRVEQEVVTSYLTAILAQLGSYEAHGPYPVKAGSVVHLRTDLTFELPTEQGLSELLAALHPTPAVCGLPKASAQQFIAQHESYERSYYAGFLGEIKCHTGACSRTNLFVNLRTIEFLQTPWYWGPWRFRSYVGGGLLPASTFESEYAEICAKNRSVLSNLKPEFWTQ